MDGDIEYSGLMPGGFKKYNRPRHQEQLHKEQISQVSRPSIIVKNVKPAGDPVLIGGDTQTVPPPPLPPDTEEDAKRKADAQRANISEVISEESVG